MTTPSTPRRLRASLIGAAIAFGLAAGAIATEGAAEPLLVRLQAKIDSLDSLKGRFVQHLDSRSLGRARRESGRFVIRKPASMRWEYEDPERKIAVTDGSTTWLHLPEDREVQIGRYPEDGDGSAASLLSGRVRLDRDFTSRQPAAEEAPGPPGVAGGVTLVLEPIRPMEEYESLILTVDPKRLAIRAVVLVDPLGGRMTFEFFDLEENPAIGDDLFRVEIPAGTEVIDTR